MPRHTHIYTKEIQEDSEDFTEEIKNSPEDELECGGQWER